MLQLLFIELG